MMRKLAGIVALVVIFATIIALPLLATPRHYRKTRHRHYVSHHVKRKPVHRVISLSQAHAAIRRKRLLAEKLHNLHHNLVVIRSRIHQADKKANHLHRSISKKRVRVEAARSALISVSNTMQQLETRHFSTLQDWVYTRNKLRHRRNLLSERIRSAYMRGQTTYAQVLLQARSMQDLLARQLYIHQIVQSDINLIGSIQRNIAHLHAVKVRIERQEDRQRALAVVFEQHKQAYLSSLAQDNSALNDTYAQRQQEQDQLDVMASEAAAMADTVRLLSSELDSRRRAEEEAWAAAHPHHTREQQRRAEAHFSEAPIWRGRFIRPLNGPITSPFGMRFHPILHRWLMHTGVDIGAPMGTPIHAAGTGTVILAHYVRGYGNTVIIDHGGGLTTLYAHCSRILVHVGERVQRGHVIALVGMTGMATGPHCHFEVRRNGVPVKPF